MKKWHNEYSASYLAQLQSLDGSKDSNYTCGKTNNEKQESLEMNLDLRRFSDGGYGIGANAGIGLTTGNHNTFVGYNAGQTVETGSGNVIIGNAAGNTANETRTMIIAGSDGSTLTTWLEGDSTGEVVVFGNPTKNLGIATKQYVDSEITSAVAAENEISEMNDVTLTSIQTGDILQWNGSAFVNFALGTIGTMAAQNANAVNISGGSITMGSLSNASTVLIKDSSGSTLKTIIGTTS